MTCGLEGEKKKSTVNQAINLGLVDSSMKTTVCVSSNWIKQIKKHRLCFCNTFPSAWCSANLITLLACLILPRRMEGGINKAVEDHKIKKEEPGIPSECGDFWLAP